MRTVTNVGLIHYTDLATPYTVDSSNESNDYQIKKVLMKGRAEAGHYPNAEVVQDAQAIIQDGSIDLVILVSPDDEGMNTVTEALSAGKNVRIL